MTTRLAAAITAAVLFGGMLYFALSGLTEARRPDAGRCLYHSDPNTRSPTLEAGSADSDPDTPARTARFPRFP